MLARKVRLELEGRRLRGAVEDVGRQHDVAALGDALRLLGERRPEPESVGEVDDGGKWVAGVRAHKQGFGDSVGGGDLEVLFDHTSWRFGVRKRCWR